jgi:amino acid transporter
MATEGPKGDEGVTTSLGVTSSGGEVSESSEVLRRNAIGFPGVLMQPITHISPAIAALFFTQFVVSLTGEAAPLVYLVGVVVVLMLGVLLAQLGKLLPSAGGYCTYVSRGVPPRAGFSNGMLIRPRQCWLTHPSWSRRAT